MTSSRFPVHTPESAPTTTRPVLETLAQRSPIPGQPINLHAQMAHSPSVLLSYMAMRQALEDNAARLDRKARTAILLSVASIEETGYTTALNSAIAAQAGWTESEIRGLIAGQTNDPRLAALLAVVRAVTRDVGRVDEATWDAARTVGWSEDQLAEAFAFAGLTHYVDAFANFAQSKLDAPFAAFTASTNGHVEAEMRLTHLLIVEDQDRTRGFYEQVLGATTIRERDPVILEFQNSWIVANVGGPPTEDKPAVTLAPPLQAEIASYALNVRVADIQRVYELWRSRGAHFLTPPIARDGEIRCYLRDPDGHLIELGQSVPETR
jgi:catechol 2,3-dioxygenase-like lactoylglutathione lyase family enzyme/alkylhydroperoxidase family enzyme